MLFMELFVYIAILNAIALEKTMFYHTVAFVKGRVEISAENTTRP
jgi:hypothetical protein